MEQHLSFYYAFYMVACKGSISAASKELYISQPAVSKSIAKLEAALETTLLIRSSKGVTLTYEGELLYQRLKVAFESIALGEEQLRYQKESEQEQLTIGISSTLCKYVLLPHLKDFVKKNPHLQISILCQSSFETIQSLKDGTIDVGFIGGFPLNDEFIFQKTHEIKDIFVASKTYLEYVKMRMQKDQIPEDDMISLFHYSNLMLLDKQNLSRKYVDHYINTYNIQADNVIEVSTMDLLIQFASIGMGVACVIENFVEEELKTGELISLPLPFTIPKRQLGLAYRKGPISSSLEQLVQLFQSPF
ncbi:MAG: LysR family transcriptional regulator [Lachnospiraceae bacterium]|nr:LysR family transcriptional regulator [Lachnospiraceae bacterium]